MTSFQQAVGMSYLFINIMVFVPYNWTSINCDNYPNSFPYDVPHTLLYLGFSMRCYISISYHVSSSKTALIICIGNFILLIFSGATLTFSVLTHASISSCVNDKKRVLLVVFYAGDTCCVSFNLLNAASFIFGVSATNIGDSMGVISLGGGLGSDC